MTNGRRRGRSRSGQDGAMDILTLVLVAAPVGVAVLLLEGAVVFLLLSGGRKRPPNNE